MIEFPVTLQWSDDISTNHQLNLDNINSCSVESTEISTVSCIGDRLTHSIKVSFNNSSNSNNSNSTTNSSLFNLITSEFKLTIPGLFSPPAINPTDIIKLSSFTSF